MWAARAAMVPSGTWSVLVHWLESAMWSGMSTAQDAFCHRVAEAILRIAVSPALTVKSNSTLPHPTPEGRNMSLAYSSSLLHANQSPLRGFWMLVDTVLESSGLSNAVSMSIWGLHSGEWLACKRELHSARLMLRPLPDRTQECKSRLVMLPCHNIPPHQHPITAAPLSYPNHCATSAPSPSPSTSSPSSSSPTSLSPLIPTRPHRYPHLTSTTNPQITTPTGPYPNAAPISFQPHAPSHPGLIVLSQ